MALTRNTYQRNSTWNAPYTFSGKEKDAETGYGYFGARYNDSGLSIWLSVDPMSDKYPSMSPYNYCANNPVILVDPDGRDIIEIEANGHVAKITKQAGNDILVSQKTGKKRELSGNGVFTDSYRQSDDKSTSLFLGLSGNDASDIYSFMGENTDVEWGYMKAQSEGQTFYLVGSNHNPDGESYVCSLVLNAPEGHDVLTYNHSHPYDGYNAVKGGNASTPDNVAPNSDPDVYVFQEILQRHPKATLGISFRGRTTTYIKDGVPKIGFMIFFVTHYQNKI